MNNFLFGDAARQYYETIGGGAGAGPGFAGRSAVQTHMTNTRMTDPEVLELRYPVQLEEFSIRRGSGGAGEWAGGDGAVRRVRFLEPMTAVIVSSRREVAPFGLAGGADGAPGRQWVEHADGRRTALRGVARAELAPGDVVAIETPGGGGFGTPWDGRDDGVLDGAAATLHASRGRPYQLVVARPSPRLPINRWHRQPYFHRWAGDATGDLV